MEIEDVKVENLIPAELSKITGLDAFLNKKDVLDAYFETIRKSLKPNEVLRYVGDLDVKNASMKVSLERVSENSPLGGVKNADSIFEIFTDGYGEYPMVIQGAGAGGEVTARGVYSDLLRIGLQL
ncbi:hypothetical protein ACFLR1_04250 [Bacteroidota bacterium]